MLSRRSLLLAPAWLACVSALSGCSWFDPTVHGPADPGRTPTPSPTPGADQLAAVGWLEELSRALAVLGSSVGATASHQAWARACQQALGLQVSVLRRPDPLTGSLPEPVTASRVTPGPTVAVARALTELSTVATGRSSDLARLADASPRGATTLLWGSLAVFAAGCARPVAPVPVNQNLLPHPFEPETLARARGVLVEHLFRAEQTCSALIGALPPGDLRTSLQNRRTALATQRVEAQNAMRAMGATPPGPEPGYQLPQRPTPNNVGAIMAAVETDVANAWAGVHCSSEPSGRAAARTAWTTQSAQVTLWGALSWFPGWV